ncbi:MAG: hypothetical protein L6R28_17880 [Planctomycetes bacterium]|nr:hypothetical protein [Planctomycetota bacterium]
MSDTGTNEPANPSGIPFTSDDVRRTYRALMQSLQDPDRVAAVATRAFGITLEQLTLILGQTKTAKPTGKTLFEQLPKRTPSGAGDPPTLYDSMPPATAMMAFKAFAARDPSHNLTLLVGVVLKNLLFDAARDGLKAHGFAPMPAYDAQAIAQKDVSGFVASSWKVDPRKLCMGVRNLSVENAGERIGALSAAAVPVDEPDLEPHVRELREALRKQNAGAEVHFACLPPLDADKLAGAPAEADAAVAEREMVSLDHAIDSKWIAKRCRDQAYAEWVQKHWPAGTDVRKLLNATYYADWMIALLAATRCPSYTLEGKRMLVRFAVLAASRALRWTPSRHPKRLLSAVEAWLKDPAEERRAEVEAALKAFKSDDEAQRVSKADAAFDYIDQAVRDGVMQAARAAASNNASTITSSACRAAAAAVLTATFAASAPAQHTWLEMVSTYAVPDEMAEHCGLCVAMRAMVLQSGEKKPA